MKRRFQRVIALACALLFGVTIFAGLPGMTARAAGTYLITAPYLVMQLNQVVHEGDILPAQGVFYVKPGMSEECYKYFLENGITHGESLPYYLHEDYRMDNYYYIVPGPIDHEVLAPEKGSSAYIVRIQLLELETELRGERYYYFLEPYTESAESGSSDNAAPAYTAPVYVYVEPAWLTAWKGLLVGIDKQIADAKAGDTVVLELGEYYNISNARMQQIAEKNDVTFVLNITYDKVSYSLTIEPGTEIDLSCDWYGPLKLLSMFPHEVVE